MKPNNAIIDRNIQAIRTCKKQHFTLSLMNESFSANDFQQLGIALAKNAYVRFIYISLHNMDLSEHQLTNLFSELSGKIIETFMLRKVSIGEASSNSLLKSLQSAKIKFTDILELREVTMPSEILVEFIRNHFYGFKLCLDCSKLNDQLASQLAQILSSKASLEILTLYALNEEYVLNIIRKLTNCYMVNLSGMRLTFRNRYIESTLPDLLLFHHSIAILWLSTVDPYAEAEIDEKLLEELFKYEQNDSFPIVVRREKGDDVFSRSEYVDEWNGLIKHIRRARSLLYWGKPVLAEKHILKLLECYAQLKNFYHRKKFLFSCISIGNLWAEECLQLKDKTNVTNVIKAILSVDSKKLTREVFEKIVMHILPMQPPMKNKAEPGSNLLSRINQKDQKLYEIALICLLYLGQKSVHATLLAHYLKLFCEGNDAIMKDYRAYLTNVSENKKLQFFLNDLHDSELAFRSNQPQRTQPRNPEKSVYTFYAALFNAGFKLQINTEQKRHLTERVDNLEQQMGHMQQQVNQIMNQINQTETSSTIPNYASS